MGEVSEIISLNIIDFYNSFVSIFPSWAQNFLGLFLAVLVVVIYVFIIWNGYRFIAKKDPLGLNLNKYNVSSHHFLVKTLAGLFYFLEYLFLAPIIIFFSFSIFTILLILLTQDMEVNTIIFISAAVIGAVRMASYYNEDMAREIAKFIPLTLLAVSILNPTFFDITRILGNLSEISLVLGNIKIYLIFIIVLESILRFFDFLFTLFGLEEVEIEEEIKQE